MTKKQTLSEVATSLANNGYKVTLDPGLLNQFFDELAKAEETIAKQNAIKLSFGPPTKKTVKKGASPKPPVKAKHKKPKPTKKPKVASLTRLRWLREDWIAKHQPLTHEYSTILVKVPPHVLDLHIDEIKHDPYQARLFHD